MSLKFPGGEQSRAYSALLNAMAYVGQNGVSSGCAVTESGPTAMTVDVAAGTVFFASSSVVVSSGSVAISSNATSFSRIDVVRVNSSGVLSVATGTAASLPLSPEYDPDNYVALAMITVPAAATTIINSYITDARVLNNSGGASGTSFTGLSDTPSSYVGQGGKSVKVNSGETALELAYDGTTVDLNSALYGDSVISGCAITEQTVPDQTVKMSSGIVLVGGTSYSISADATINLTAADASDPRYDLVSVNSAGTVTVTAGTAAGSPTVPSLPSNEVPLAVIYRAATDNVIETADIDDCRRLIDMPYYEANNNRVSVESGNSGYSLAKTITVTAYRCQKYLKVIFDLSSFTTRGSSLTAADDSQVDLQFRIDGVTHTSAASYIRQSYDPSPDSTYSVNDSAVKVVYLTADDVDFTQNIELTLYLKGDHTWLGTTLNGMGAINNTFTVEGK